MAAKCSFGMHTYCKNVALCHWPSVFIVESSTPAIAAVVATQILKLWPVYCCWGRLMAAKIAQICVTNQSFVTVPPEVLTKNGPC